MFHYLALGLIVAIVYALFVKVVEKNHNICRQWLTVQRDTKILAIAAFVTAPFLYEFAGPASVPVTLEKGELVQHPWGVFTIGNSSSYSNMPTGEIGVENAPPVTVLTDNPKVRTISHGIVVKIQNPELFYMRDPERIKIVRSVRYDNKGSGVHEHIELLVAQRLYDLNNFRSRDFSGLFNPLDPKQQEEYGRLIYEHLAPKLSEDGLVILRARFGIK